MATRTSSLAYTNSTDANFRLWINEVHNSLIAFGWLQTSDTGQINFTTVTRPTTTNTYQGYAVYQMNDSLQSTCAVYMRIDFGTGAAADAPAIKVQICIGSTNGAGTLTGNLGTQQTLNGDVAQAAAQTCRISGTSSSFRMAMWLNDDTSARGWVLAIERDRNTSGAEVSTGVNFITFKVASSNTLTITSQFLETAGGTGAVDTKWYAMISAQTSQSGGGNVGVGPVRTQLGPMRNPMIGMLVYSRTDFTPATTNPVTIYGSSHTYIMLKNLSTSITLVSQNSDCGFALLWE